MLPFPSRPMPASRSIQVVMQPIMRPCSMCLGMNPDILETGQRCASTSNRNFENRQGKGGRTHLVSPAMAAAAGVAGHFVDIREW